MPGMQTIESGNFPSDVLYRAVTKQIIKFRSSVPPSVCSCFSSRSIHGYHPNLRLQILLTHQTVAIRLQVPQQLKFEPAKELWDHFTHLHDGD